MIKPDTILFIRIIPILFLIFSLIGCAEEVKESKYGGTLVLSTLTEFEGLNPILYRQTFSVNIGDQIFNSLVRFNEKWEFVPDLAESWQVSEDGLVWSFKLRRGVRFHDGVELTSEDILFTFDSIIDPETGSPFASLYRMVESFEAAGRYGFKVTLKEPYAPLLFLLYMEIVPAHLFKEKGVSQQEFGRRPVGTGPFKFSEWRSGELVLTANEDYFEGRPYLDEVIVKVFSNKLSAWSALMQGKTDVVMDLAPEDFRIIEDDPRFKVYDYPEVFYYTILFNLEDTLFTNEKIREAIDISLDRSDIIDRALSGWGIATTGPFRPGTWPYNPSVSGTYEPGRALRILAEMGWKDTDGDFILEKDGRDLGFTLLVDKGDTLKEVAAQRIRWQLFHIGIKVNLEFIDLQELFREKLVPGKFQAVLMQFNGSGDPDKYTYLFWHSKNIGKWNWAHYRNEQVDHLIEKGKVTAGFQERQKIYQKIHSIIAGDRPAAFLFFRRHHMGISSKFEGIRPDLESFFRSVKDWHLVEKS